MYDIAMNKCSRDSSGTRTGPEASESTAIASAGLLSTMVFFLAGHLGLADYFIPVRCPFQGLYVQV